MSIIITRKPLGVSAQSHPIYFELETNRAIITPYEPSGFRLEFSLPIANLTRILFDGYDFTLITDPADFDQFNTFHIDISNTPTPLEVRNRFISTIQRVEGVNERWTTFTDLLNPGRVSLRTKDGTLFTGTAQVLNQSSVNVTPPSVSAIPGLTPELQVSRENYRLLVEPYIETAYTSYRFERAGRLQRPSLLGKNVQTLTVERFVFELQSQLRSYLGYDWPALSGYDSRHLIRCIRQFYIRFAEAYNSSQPSSKWFYSTNQQPNPNDPYAPGILGQGFFPELPEFADLFTILNADLELIEGIRQKGGVSTVCADSSEFEYPDALSEYFGDSPRRWLTTDREKHTFHRAYEWLSFFVSLEQSSEVGLYELAFDGVKFSGETFTGSVSELFISPTLCQPATGIGPRLLEVSFVNVWPEVPENAAELCVWVQKPGTTGSFYPWGDHGTFEALTSSEGGENNTGHEVVTFAPPQQGGTGGPDLFIEGTTTQAQTGAYSLAVVSNTEGNLRGGAQPYFIEPVGTVTTTPGEEYIFSAWVKLGDFNLEDGFGTARLGVADPATATVNVIQASSYLDNRGGDWVYIESVLTATGTSVKPQIQFSEMTAAPGASVSWIDSIQFVGLAVEPEQITEKLTLILDDECKDWQTLVFQNALGVPESIHLNSTVNTEWQVRREEAQTIQRYKSSVDIERRERFTLEADTVVKRVLRVLFPPPATSRKIPELLRSAYVELIATKCLPNGKCEPAVTQVPSEVSRAFFRFKIESKAPGATFDFRLGNTATPCQQDPFYIENARYQYGFNEDPLQAMQSYIDDFNALNIGVAYFDSEGAVITELDYQLYTALLGIELCGQRILPCIEGELSFSVFPTALICEGGGFVQVGEQICNQTLLPVIVETDSFESDEGAPVVSEFELELTTSRKFLNTQS